MTVDLAELARQQNTYALRLAAEFDFHVFPVDHPALKYCAGVKTKTHNPDTCKERGKHPVPRSWSEYATTDPELLQAPHYFGGPRPRNIGTACKQSRLLVVDEDALHELDRFCADHGVELPATFTVITREDRRHFYLRPPDGFEHGNSEGAFSDYEINVRGPGGPNNDGGYVIGPGSLHASGHVYTLAPGTREIIPAPEWVLEAVKAPARSRDNGDGERAPGFDWERALTPGAIPSGKQRPALISAACSLRYFDATDGLALPLLRRVLEAFDNTKPDDPWTPEHADEIWEWAKDTKAPGEHPDVIPALVDPPSSGNGQQSGGAQPDIVRLADVTRERVSWVWPGRIPVGKLTIIEGDPERAKSTVTLDLAARVSTGSPMPDGHRPDGPGGVLLVCAEDDVADTIIPRLEAHGADLSKIATLKLKRDDAGRLIPLSIPEDLPRLERAIKRAEARLVVVDPITAYLSEEINSHNDPSVRRALTPLGDVAQRLGAAIVLVRHLNKDKSQKNALYRGGGSIAFSGSARSVLVVDRHPEDPKLVVLARVKNNLAVHVPSLGYRIGSDLYHESPRIDWQGEVPIDADTLLRGPDGRLDAPARDEAVELLRELLADGPMAAKEVRRLATEAGVTRNTLDRAKDRLGVLSARRRDDSGKTTGWVWRLPDPNITEGEKNRARDPESLQTDLGVLGGCGASPATESNNQNPPEPQDGGHGDLGGVLDVGTSYDPRYDPPSEAPGAL